MAEKITNRNKNPYSDKASFFLVKTSISTISRLQIDLSLFYRNAENGEIRYDVFGETLTNILLVEESVFGHVLTAFSLNMEWQSTTCNQRLHYGLSFPANKVLVVVILAYWKHSS